MSETTTCRDCGAKLSPYRFKPNDSENVRHNLKARCRACMFGVETKGAKS